MRRDDESIDDTWEGDEWVGSQEPDRDEVLRLARQLAEQQGSPS
jgi:hypothetical protein